tara:strand:+ start:1502 stop:1759 length:258 start_codon:yes stop_codon:yes gene_type:complete
MNKDNSGALFKNEHKKSDKHPDYTGVSVINGVEFRIASWINTTEQGKTYMSLAFTPPEETAKYKKETTDSTPVPKFEKKDNDLPF